MLNRITFDTNIIGGRARIRGMRIPVSVVVGQVADGATWDEVLCGYPDLERDDIGHSWNSPSSHQRAAGKNTARGDQALGRTRGGFGTKIHLAVDFLGDPALIPSARARMRMLPGPRNYWGNINPEPFWATKSYDSDRFIEVIDARSVPAR